jgi:hypothetical protein
MNVIIEGIDKFEGCHKNVMSKSKECHIDEMKTNIGLLNNLWSNLLSASIFCCISGGKIKGF